MNVVISLYHFLYQNLESDEYELKKNACRVISQFVGDLVWNILTSKRFTLYDFISLLALYGSHIWLTGHCYPFYALTITIEIDTANFL